MFRHPYFWPFSPGHLPMFRHPLFGCPLCLDAPHAFGHPPHQIPPIFWTHPHAFGHPPDASDVPIFSNTPLYVFRCRNLALIFFSGMYVLHLGGMWAPPVYFHAPMHSDAPNAPLYIPNASLCICMFMGYLNRNGGCGDSPSVWTSPMCCMPPHLSNTPTYLYAALHVCLSRPQHPPKDRNC